MKKTFLLLMAGVIAASANGQQAQQSAIFNHAPVQNQHMVASPGSFLATPPSLSAITGGTPSNAPLSVIHNDHRTTVGGGRWYYYSGIYQHWLDSLNSITTYPDSIQFSGLDIWQDTTDYMGYASTSTTSVYQYSPFTSYGMILDPLGNEYNDGYFFPSAMAVSGMDAYTIDSVQINGWYNRSFANARKIAVVDTLIISFAQGNIRTTSHGNTPVYYFTGPTSYTTGNLNFATIGHDSVNNRAGAMPLVIGTITGSVAGDTGYTATPLAYTGTSAGPIYKFLLKSTDTNGSNSGANTTFPRAAYNGVTHSDISMAYPVSAGNSAGIAVSFKSGDTSYHALQTFGSRTGQVGDTVRYSALGVTTGYKFGNWEGEFYYDGDGSTAGNPEFGPYMVTTWSDWTCGLFKREGPTNYRDGGWGGIYEPNWSWSAASVLQYPLISFHITCTTCTGPTEVKNVTTSNTVTAYPNPAGNILNISYNLVTNTDLTITLTNMLGQVVATQNIGGTLSGKAVFNTTTLPEGMYIYNLQGNGIVANGRVVIAH